ncbi:MAG: DNA repair protein RecN [Nitrospirae bacterium]|nr:DNA repair protein RecN [Nitrospirota bacterium]
MLREITIKDLTVIDDIRIELSEGLNVLTGETGAGKSIIVDALGLVLGQRAQQDMIRQGSSAATVSAFFETSIENPVTSKLSIDTSEGIFLRRTLSQSGKNRSYINDSAVNTQTLAEIGKTLVDIHSQFENQSLLSTDTQLRLLDTFGHTADILTAYTILFTEYNSTKEQIETLSENLKQKNQRIDFLKYQITEISSASLEDNELEHLMEQQKILSNLSSIKQLSEDTYSLLYSANNSINDSLSKVVNNLSKLSEIDSETFEMLEMSNQVVSLLSELHLGLRGYKESIELSPERLEEVEDRLTLIRRLQKKYGSDIKEIKESLSSAESELQVLIHAEDSLLELTDSLIKIKEDLTDTALALSKKRKETALILSKKIQEILKELSFEKASFNIHLIQNTDDQESYRFQRTGIDNIEYLFSANPGMPERPIQKTASGGELSRVMLGLKAIFAEFDNIPVLIFDEVDAGIGGETAEVVGEKLKEISRNHQVLCITHLPQIAAKADNHLKVIKDVSGDRVKITVKTLKDVQREQEIARMLSGTETDISLKHARQLLNK